MKVSVYRREDGGVDVLVQASVGSGKSPLVLSNPAKDGLRGKLLEAFEGQKRPELPARLF